MLISDTIKLQRKSNKLTQSELACKMNCNRQKIADWERGKSTPAADDLILLAKCFKVSVDYLLGLSDIPTSDKDIDFVCKYTGLSLHSVDFLHLPFVDEYNRTVEFLTNGNVAPLHLSLSREFSKLKKSFTELYRLKSDLNDSDLSYYDNPEQIEADLEEVESIENDISYSRYKISRIMEDMIDVFCNETINDWKQIERIYHDTEYELRQNLIIMKNERERDDNAHNPETQE